jgi:hypothetical protein
MELRICKVCGVEKELSPVFFSVTRGVWSERTCRACRKLANKVLEKSKPYLKTPEGTTRICGKCGETKLLVRDNFRVEKGYFKKNCRACTKSRKRRKSVDARRRIKKRYKAKYPEKIRAQKQTGLYYFKNLLAAGTKIKASQIPEELAEAKRMQIRILREIKSESSQR